MESLKLGEQEVRAYAELFHACDVENAGKVTGVKASELFLTSGLPQEVLQQVTELCGAKRLGHFGRSQFYIALKLIAVAQCGLPLSLESFNAGVEIPLPKFVRQYDGGTEGWRSQTHPAFPQHMDPNFAYTDGVGQGVMHAPMAGVQPQQIPQAHVVGGLPPPPTKHHARGFSAGSRMPGFDHGQVVRANSRESPHNTVSPHFSPESPPISPSQKMDGPAIVKPLPVHAVPGQVVMQAPAGIAGQYVGAQPGYMAANVQVQPGVPSQHQYEGPASMDNRWTSFEPEEESQEKQWAVFPEPSKITDTSSISSEAESIDDIWAINDEQREYYVNQFKTMQPDLAGVIVGSVAKEFFEKSKLPVPELKKIWQLSDVDRDGSLSLEEFCTAMHLVVLRRNEVELPDNLPPVLMPYVPLVNPDEPFAADLPPGSTMLPGSTLSMKSQSPTSLSPQPQPQITAQQWPATFPTASPTSSSVSSPGSKSAPVNFDFKPIADDRDSKIAHPVALRMSPDGQPIPVDNVDSRGRAFSVDTGLVESGAMAAEGEAPLSPSRQTYADPLLEVGHDTHPPMQLNTPLQSRPRPTPKKAQSISGPTMDGPGQPLIKPPPSSQDIADRPNSLAVGSMGEGAPPPPPRVKSGHSRSSSLDNQLIDLSEHAHGQSQLLPPPAVPPRPSPKDVSGHQKKLVNQDHVFSAIDTSQPANFANFSKFETIPSQEVLNVISDSHPGSVNGTREQHRRSMSLDYNQFSMNSFGSGPSYQGPGVKHDSTDLQATGQSLSEVKKRLNSREDSDETDRTGPSSKLPFSQRGMDKRDLQLAIRKQKQQNTMLLRLNNELNQELQEVMEQRIALEIQLEHLRPFST